MLLHERKVTIFLSENHSKHCNENKYFDASTSFNFCSLSPNIPSHNKACWNWTISKITTAFHNHLEIFFGLKHRNSLELVFHRPPYTLAKWWAYIKKFLCKPFVAQHRPWCLQFLKLNKNKKLTNTYYLAWYYQRKVLMTIKWKRHC